MSIGSSGQIRNDYEERKTVEEKLKVVNWLSVDPVSVSAEGVERLLGEVRNVEGND